ncbi:Up-regulated during septation-domain-containing protein [Staphylotrichum tortipilum]|uniref:Up-regulated during septation-domain-containing protein n=1 Tax=Staphylotrichum tortipilum TaxID=2831512 RepID=A0AAN6MBZ4_9PEZI|nr:Up-regulated during septation-domain-containing protein [Staphylotrichum longicolle]
MNGAATRIGGGPGPARGAAPRGNPFAAPARPPPPAAPPAIAPTGKALVEGYRKDVLNGFEKDKPRYNPMNENRPQSSPLVDLRDPIQVHLLTETALSDSRGFEILAPEEVDDLKKQMQSLSMRIDQARANLAIQSKYRDAAISMARLYSPPSSKADGKRRSLLSNNRLSDSAKEAEMERLASERRCEELASDLFSLEKRLMEPQRRLLQHTAGVLQMTHRASQKKSGQLPVGPMMMNGIPGSPESLYTYTNTRNSIEIPNDDLYLPLDQVDGPPAAPRPRKNTIEIPMKSPIREQNAQLRELREEVDRMKEENERILEENIQLKSQSSRLQEEHARATEENARFRSETSRMADADARMRAIEDQMMAETDVLREQGTGQLKAISETEAKLEVLNRKLRDLIVAFNPAKNGAFGGPGAAGGSGETLTRQLEYMEAGLATATEASADAAAMASSLDEAGMRVQALAQQVQAALQQSGAGLPPPPEGTLDEQLGYLEDALQTIGSELSSAAEASTSVSAGKRNVEQVDAVLMGLWEIIQAGYAEIEQQKATRRQNRALGQGGGDDDDDLSSNEFEGFASEPYSLQAFSTKVQWLYAQATGLREQKSILQRQIKQQRELNNRSESEKDTELAAKSAELERTQALLDDAQTQLQQVLDDMDTLQKTTAANEAASESSTKATQDALKERAARITALEAEVRDTETRLAAADASIAAAQSQLSESNTARATAESELASLQTQLKSTTEAADAASAEAAQLQDDLKTKDDELEQMNMMVVELKTEVAFAKAELDGAYGSRKQRAAEAAALSSTAQSEELNGQIARLRGELENALKDLEEITRESIAAERERLDIEGRLDEVMGVKAELEGEVKGLSERLGRVQEELDKERLRVATPAAGGATGRVGAGASMLSEQFRGVMKEERRKFQEEMKEEQAKRRKLEEELRALKRAQGGQGGLQAGLQTQQGAVDKGMLSPR